MNDKTTTQPTSPTRDNHYVPQWYQAGFIEPGQAKLAYLDMSPPETALPDGRTFRQKSRFQSYPSQCFHQHDLYSTFFGAAINDEIERRLFGEIDTRGADAVRAFIGTDPSKRVQHFQDFFAYIDAQKIRTPKGLDWLKAKYPRLAQNDLMMEMQGVRTIHCSIWSGGVREIVSSEDSPVKFITTDHPVTIYNHALPPTDPVCKEPHDPDIALKGSQTIFPLSRDYCLILTNLEYARDPTTNPIENRTFARKFHSGLVKADALIRERKLTPAEVTGINFILKSRARRYLAAGKEEWLYPEKAVTESWQDHKGILLPPQDELYNFGGEIFVRYNDGHFHHQDEFGRSEKPFDFLAKDVDETKLRADDWCGCGSGKQYRKCCKLIAPALRRTWKEASIRERNIFLYNAIAKELQLDTRSNWVEVRQHITNESIARIYRVFAALWPRETDLLQLLPKPDGSPRAVYSGCLHPSAINEFAPGVSLYFGELLIEHPFVHARAFSKAYSPTENPKSYRQEFLKSVLAFVNLAPLMDAGLVNLVPDPMTFDVHLRDQIMGMAKMRAEGMKFSRRDDPRIAGLMEEDARRCFLALPPDALRAQVRELHPDFSPEEIGRVLAAFERQRQRDPLAVLQDDTFGGGKDGGLLNTARLAPNFEMAMYLAQATGASIVTDSFHRWQEIRLAIALRPPSRRGLLGGLTTKIDGADFIFPNVTEDVVRLSSQSSVAAYAGVMRDALRYASRIETAGAKPNVEANLAARFARTHQVAQNHMAKELSGAASGRITCAMPFGGIHDNTINRLLLMSNSEHHLAAAPMAFLVSRDGALEPAPQHFLANPSPRSGQ